jgi:hypothetical protein
LISNMSTALDAARRGWPVFPLAAGAKVPAIESWESAATTDEDRLTRYWTWPGRSRHGVAIACGPARLVVIDLDRPKPDQTPPHHWRRAGITDGTDVLAQLCADAEQPFPADTYTVQTGRGGLHLYFTAPVGIELRNTEGETGRGLGWLIDTRAAGGYVVSAGSVVQGRRYELVHDVAPAPLPTWLAQRLAPPPVAVPPSGPVRLTTGRAATYLQRAIAAECGHVADAVEGGRNKALFIAAQSLGQLAAGGALSADDIRTALMAAAAGPIAAGAYSATQADKTITSGLRAGAKRPRKVAA